MFRNASILIVIASMLVLSGAAQAARDVTGPLDTVVGVPDNDTPPNELPPLAVDDQVLTKYLHYKGGTQATGFRVTPAMGPTVVTALTFTTANDADGRDPADYELSGSNVSIDGPYTLIAAGPIEDFVGTAAWPRRTKTTTPIQFENDIAYEHYQVMFPTVRTAGNYMQIAEVELLTPVFKADTADPADGAVHADTWANLSWTAGEAAVSHDVYFGESLDDVTSGAESVFYGNQATNFFVVGFPGFPHPEGLVPGTTYYWRIDEVDDANPDSPWVGDVWSFTVPPKIAWRPFPPDGAKFADPNNLDLSWSLGWGARLHTVYFGDNFDDVNNAAGGLQQVTATYTPGTLELDKTYYWRVDEFDILATHKGDVWSFTTAGGGGGIKGEYFNNVTLSGTPVLTRIDPDVNFNWGGSGPGAPLPDNGWSARWTADLDISIADTFTFSVNSEGGTRLWIDGEQVINMWVSWVPTKYASLPMYLERGIHSLRLEFADWDRNAQQQLSWSTPTMAEQIIPAGPLQPPLRAGSPNPPNGAVDVKQTPILSWSPGDQAASHQVYFGTDENAVLNAAAGSPEDKGTKDLGSESYEPGQLEWDTTYYWRVDEVNDTNPGSPWTGAVLSLKTANFPVIDDFEYYNDLEPDNPQSNNIFYTWLDGFEDPANGSLVGYEFPPFTERTIVHGGKQSMPLYYDNSVTHSEVTMTLDYPTDWTEGGVNTLTIWFYGDPDNAVETLYVALNGTAIVTHDNPDAAQIAMWTEWNIDLQAFADLGVDLTNVNTIAIGLGNKNNPQPGGTGTMYFDDIALH